MPAYLPCLFGANRLTNSFRSGKLNPVLRGREFLNLAGVCRELGMGRDKWVLLG